MSLISLKNSSETEVTVLSNRFIDNFMPRANGEFVKVYIYLLRVVSAAPSSFNLEDMADRLLCTDRDISRALKYWEAEKLISLTYTADQQLSGICFCCRNRFCFCCLRFCYLRADECECNQPSHS